MNRRVVLLIMLLTVAVLLAGCSFALEEEEAGQDVLCGVSVIMDDPGAPDGVDEDGNVFWYADETESEPVEMTEEEFKALLAGDTSVFVQPEEMDIGKYYWYLYTEENEYGITNGSRHNWPGEIDKTHMITNDDGDGFELEGTIFICDDMPEYAALYFASIYMRPDGSLYAVRDAAGVSGHIDGFSQTIRTESTIKNIDGETEKKWSEIKVNVKQVEKTISASILAFDAQHRLIAATVLSPEKSDDGWECGYELPEGAAYLLLEETKESGEMLRACADVPAEEDASSMLFKYYLPNGDGFALPCRVWLTPE